jgi:uracil-DNA glycosylase family 4
MDEPDLFEPKQTLAELKEEAGGCTACPLFENATQTVFGEGSAGARLMLVGEQPGDVEDRQGRPFVGPAGQLLDELLNAIGWMRGDVFITNVVKCRPPGNRDPEPAEIAACSGYLDRQELALDPAVVVTLGRHSLQRYLPGARIGAIHGSLRRAYTGQHVFPMYHPAAALHQASLRETLFHDMRGLPAALLTARRALTDERMATVQAEEAVARIDDEAAPTDDTEQMTLFQEQ